MKRQYGEFSSEKVVNWDTMDFDEKKALVLWIVDNHQYRKVKSQGHIQTFDAFSASAVKTILENIKPENQKKLLSGSLMKTVNISMSLLEKHGVE